MFCKEKSWCEVTHTILTFGKKLCTLKLYLMVHFPKSCNYVNKTIDVKSSFIYEQPHINIICAVIAFYIKHKFSLFRLIIHFNFLFILTFVDIQTQMLVEDILMIFTFITLNSDNNWYFLESKIQSDLLPYLIF